MRATQNRITLSGLVQTAFVVIVLVVILYCIVQFVKRLSSSELSTNTHEGFGNHPGGATNGLKDVDPKELAKYSKSHKKTRDEIYDKFYANVYRELIDKFRRKGIQFEIHDMINRTKLPEYGSRAVFLDLGCGTGSHIVELARRKLKWMIYGLDQSTSMLNHVQGRVKKYRGKTRLIQGDFEEPDLFPADKFTHVYCYYFSIYYAKQPKKVFQNVHTWLKPGGYFCVHVVDPERFDPVLDAANPFLGVSLQKYMKPGTRRTNSKVYFNNFIYKSDFNYDPKTHDGSYTEEFIHPKKRHIRKHTHTFKMMPHNRLIGNIRRAGFNLKHITKLYERGDNYEYLCYFQKK